MLDLDQAIRERHSTRLFLPQPVPRELVNGPVCAIELQHPAVAYGVRIWSMPGPPRRCPDRRAQRRPPNVPPLPASFQHFRNELGAQVYGAMGISREDTARHAAAVLRNWEFFRAPVAGIVCMHRDLGPANALSVGMFLQTLLLALTERGLGSCVEVSISGYPEIVRAQLAIPTELSILCGLAIGYPDPEFPANKLHIAREPIGENVVFLDN
jgi:nitroreductase